jgi:hypothetical protein
MNRDDIRQLSRIPNSQVRGPSMGASVMFLLCFVAVVVGGVALYEGREQPTIVEFKPSDDVCRAKMNDWLYGTKWPSERTDEQWTHFKRHMGECLR